MSARRSAARARWVRRLVTTVLAAAAGGGALLALRVLDHGPIANLALLVAGTVLLAVATWTVQEHGERAQPAVWFPSRREEAAVPTALDHRLTRLRRDLRDTIDRADRPDSIRPLLVELAQERLERRFTDTEGPGELPPELRAYLRRPVDDTRRRSPRELEAVIHRIEEM